MYREGAKDDAGREPWSVNDIEVRLNSLSDEDVLLALVMVSRAVAKLDALLF
jgi:hypothetical protein